MNSPKRAGASKVCSLIIAVFFLFQQSGWPASEMARLNEYEQAVKPAGAIAPEAAAVPVQADITALDFLQQENPLAPSVEPELLTEEEIAKPQTQSNEYDRYSVDEALDLLRPEYAAAVIVKSVSADDLRRLRELSFETAIVVLSGEIVLFSTGNESEIGASAQTQELLKKATFVSHMHPAEANEDGPSAFDLSHAADAPDVEYVVTALGAYAYNKQGLQNGGQAFSLEDMARKIQTAQDSARQSEGNGQVAARADLNGFIREMDLYNQLQLDDRETFRRGDPVPVSTIQGLMDMQNDLTGDYYLVNDIDLSGVNWQPIGAGNNPFRGSFNGNGFTIRNLTIDRPNQDYIGLFGSLESAGTIENVKLENVSITGRNNVGSLSGYIFLTSVSGSSTEGGSVTGTDRVGGLIGESYNGLGINNSHTSVAVQGHDQTGGIVGKLWDGVLNNINQGYSLGTVNGHNQVGGLAGYSKSGDLVRSYASGNITGQDSVGGLVGSTTENAGIKNSYYSGGTVSGTTNNVGGIAGYYNSYDDGIYNTYFAGIVTSTASAGGFLGTYNAGVISSNYWDETLNPGLQDSVNRGDMANITAETTAAMKTQSTYEGWDFKEIWVLDGYPKLRQAIAISTLEELQAMSGNLTARYYLVNDIDASGVNWQPVGTGNDPYRGVFNPNAFRGSFNGNGFTIRNLTIDRPNQDYIGLFGSLESAGTIENVKLENVSITGRNNVGSLSGYIFLTSVSGSSTEGGSVTGTDRVGGLIGESYNGLGINNSHTSVAVQGHDQTGGIVGKLWDGVLNNINQGYSLGTVNGHNQVGGLAGYSKSGDLVRSYASGNITGQDSVGGLVGSTTENAGIKNSYYSGGTVSGTTNNVGGIAGYYNSYDDGIYNTYFAGIVTSTASAGGFLGTYNAGVISSNYWDETLNPGLQDSVNRGDMANITAETTAAMKTQSTYEGWDFSSIWVMDGYPRFRPESVEGGDGSVSVRADNGFVTSPYASVTFEAPEGTTEMRYGYVNGNGPVQLGGWGSYQPSASVSINTANVGGQDGLKTFYAQYRNAAGVETAIVSYSFTADTLPPSGTVQIAKGSSDTGSHDVNIALAVDDAVSGIQDMRISVDGGALWTAWGTVQSPVQVHLPRGGGEKEVRVEVRDAAGNKAVISDTIVIEEDLLSDIVADADSAQSNPLEGDISGLRTGDRYTISGIDAIEHETVFTFDQGLDMRGDSLAFRFNVLEGSGEAKLELKEKLANGSYVTREIFSPVPFHNAGSGEREIIFPLAYAQELSKINAVVLTVQGEGGPFQLEISDFDLRASGYEPPAVSNGDVLTNSIALYTFLNVNGQSSHTGEFFPENWGLTETGAYRFSGVQQGGTETSFFQYPARVLDAAGKILRIVYESSTGAPGAKITLRNAQGSQVYELPLTAEFEATASGERKILEFQIPDEAEWQEIDQIILATYGQGAIDLTLDEVRVTGASQPVLTDPLSLIAQQDPGKIFLSPELFAGLDPDKTIADVLRDAQNRIVRIETQEDVFAYFYDAQGRLVQTVQAAKENGEIIPENQYDYGYEPVNGGPESRLQDIREYHFITERNNAARGVTPAASSSLKPDPNAAQPPFPPANATDGSGGDSSRPWIAALNDPNPSLTLDLGQWRMLDEVRVDARFFSPVASVIYPTHFVLSGSLDGSTWFDLATYDSPEFQEGTNKVYKFEIGPVQARFVRIRDIQAVIPYWVPDLQNYPEFAGFPVLDIKAYVSELEVFEALRTPVLTHVYRPEYGCLYGCDTAAGNPVAKISKNRVTETGEISAPEVTLVSSRFTQDETVFLDFLVDGENVRRQVPGPLQEGNNLSVFSFENEDGSQTLVPVNVVLDRVKPSATLAGVSTGNPALGQTYRDSRFNLTGITDAASGLAEIRYRVDGGAWTLVPLPAGADLALDIRFPEGWGDRDVEIEIEDRAGNIRTLSQTVTIEVSAYLADVDFKYFTDPYNAAHGAFESTHSYPNEGYSQRLYTQPTDFGFTAQLLSNLIAGRIVVDYMTRDQAIAIFKNMITHLLDDQTNSKIGVMGLLPWMNFDSSTQDWRRDLDYGKGIATKNGRRFMAGDNLNMAMAFAASLGALSQTEDNGAGDIAVIKSKLQAFLNNQAAGYACLASNVGGDNPDGAIRRGIIISENAGSDYAVSSCNDVRNGGTTVAFVNEADTLNPDRSINVAFERSFGSEFRAGILFAVLNYNLPNSVYKNLKVEIENYSKGNGWTYVVATGQGSAFQMLWPTLGTPETLNRAQLRMQENFVDAALDYAGKTLQPGFLSAAYGSSGGYIPGIGIPDIAIYPAGLNAVSTSLYTLGAAFGVDPDRITPFLETMLQRFPGLVTSHGLWEGVDMQTSSGAVIQQQINPNVASFILGILGSGAQDLLEYLTPAQETRLNTILWQPAGADYDVVASSPDAFSWQMAGQPAFTSSRNGDAYHIQAGSLVGIGTAFKQGSSGSINTSGKRLLINYRASTNAASATAANLKIEFKDVNGLVIRQQVNLVDLRNTGQNVVNQVVIDLPEFIGTAQINEIVFVLTGSGKSLDVTFEDVDLIDLDSTQPLVPGGGGGGGARPGPSDPNKAKSQEYTLQSYELFIGKARVDAEAGAAKIQQRLDELKNIKNKSKEEKAEEKQLKAQLQDYKAILDDIVKFENQLEGDWKILAHKGTLSDSLLDDLLIRYGGIYAFLYPKEH